MVVRLSVRDVRGAFDKATLGKAEVIRNRHLIKQIDVSDDGRRISSTVAGSRPKPYSQAIMFQPADDGVRILGYCSCASRVNCKHVAAVVLAHANFDQDDVVTTSPSPAPAYRSEPSHTSTRAQLSALATSQSQKTAQASVTLSHPVSVWLERLEDALMPSHPAQSSVGPNQRALRFVLNHEDQIASIQRVPRIRAISARVRKDGSLADEKYYNPEMVLRPREHIARFLTEEDVELLRGLLMLRHMAPLSAQLDVTLGANTTSEHVLQTLLQSGLLHYGRLDGCVLRDGPQLRAEPRWVQIDGGKQKLVFMPADQDARAATLVEGDGVRFDVVLPLKRLHYVDLTQGMVGAIETDLPPNIAVEVARAPSIAPSEAAIVKEMMRRRLRPLATRTTANMRPETVADAAAAQLLPFPEAPDNVETRTVKPIPQLELRMASCRVANPQHAWYLREAGGSAVMPLPVARLSFDYDGEIVRSGVAAATLERMERGRLILTPRDPKAETAAANKLAKLGFKSFKGLPFAPPADQADDLFLAPPGKLSAYDFIRVCDDPGRFLAFSAEQVPELVQQGWQVLYSDDYPYRLAEGAAEWWADVGEGSGIDWFSFELGVEFEGHRINLVPQLVGTLARLPAEMTDLPLSPEQTAALTELLDRLCLYHTLPDGRLLPLPGARLTPILLGLLELVGPHNARLDGGKVKLHRAEAAALAAFAGGVSDVAWAASAERLVELGERLRNPGAFRRVTAPRSFKAKLRPYQSDGLAWLDFLRDSGFGGVLADDMGLGKTVQALAFLSREKAEGRLDKPALIVSPTSVLPNWQAEAERFAPRLSVLALRGLERKNLFGQMAKHDLVLTTYPLLARDHETLLAQEFHVAILDEAQAIKNPKATVSGIAHRINARHRLALTGTPLENNLGEVWSLFEFLSPGLLGDESTFRRTFRTPIEKHGDAGAQSFLSSRLKPFMLRRTKEAVAPELPPKTEILERVRLEGAQRDLYETVRSLMHAKVRDEIARKGLAKSHIVFLDALLKLRQICCDPRLLKMTQARKVKTSAKLDRLMEMVPELVGEGRRILLFSQFTSMLELIEAELQTRKIPYVQLTGDTADRATPVREFQSGKVPVFLLSLKAGGTGLNLTAADTVIHYDPWWNPAVEAQATDRAYRIGQDKPVFVYKMIVEEGIEEAIEQLKARKAALADALFAGSAKTPLDLTEADISALFAPLDRRVERKAA